MAQEGHCVSQSTETPPSSLVHLVWEASAQQVLFGACHCFDRLHFYAQTYSSHLENCPLPSSWCGDGPKITFQMLQLVLVSPAP